MNAPRIEIDLYKVEHNTRVLVERLAVRDIQVQGVTKATLGSPAVAAAMFRGGATSLGDSRVENLARLAERDGLAATLSRTLIRSPMISQVASAIGTAHASLNTEAVVIRALDAAAREAGVRHGIVLMVELGDLREGIAVNDVAAAASVVRGCRSLDLLGIGANLACQNGVIPDEANMQVLDRLVEQLETVGGRTLDVVSGGNSASLEWALTTDRPGRTNQLRLGEAILLGTEPLNRTPIPGLYTDAFTLVGEVIEVAEKSAQPWGVQAQAAYGTPSLRSGTGTLRQAIVGLGRQDVDVDGITVPAGIAALGMSSDHFVLNLGDHPAVVGEELRFGLDYSALVRAMTSPFITKSEHAHPARSGSAPAGMHS